MYLFTQRISSIMTFSLQFPFYYFVISVYFTIFDFPYTIFLVSFISRVNNMYFLVYLLTFFVCVLSIPSFHLPVSNRIPASYN